MTYTLIKLRISRQSKYDSVRMEFIKRRIFIPLKVQQLIIIRVIDNSLFFCQLHFYLWILIYSASKYIYLQVWMNIRLAQILKHDISRFTNRLTATHSSFPQLFFYVAFSESNIPQELFVYYLVILFAPENGSRFLHMLHMPLFCYIVSVSCDSVHNGMIVYIISTIKGSKSILCVGISGNVIQTLRYSGIPLNSAQ